MKRTIAGLAAVLGLSSLIGVPASADHPGPPASRPFQGSEEMSRPGGRVDWQPNAEVIAFDKPNADGNFDLYAMNPSGDVLRSFTDGNANLPNNTLHSGNPSWRPQGDFLAFIHEEPDHCCGSDNSQPGIGIFNNIWVSSPDASQFWRLTDIPIKRSLADPTPAIGIVNPHFNHTGDKLVWTERYQGGGNWGRWRIKSADFVVSGSTPSLENEEVLFQPPANADGGIYVTATTWTADDSKLILAGNLDGQHEFSMDQYVYNIVTGTRINLTDTEDAWEEGSCLGAGERLVFQSDIDTHFPLDPNDPEWWAQPHTKEYWVSDLDGSNQHALTWFNHPDAPEYTGQRTHVADCSFASDGKRMAGTVVLDQSSGDTADPMLTIRTLDFDWTEGGDPVDPRAEGPLEDVTELQRPGGRVDWKPNSEHIAFDKANADSNFDMYMMDSGGGVLRSFTEANPALPNNALHSGNPTWRPQGDFLAFIHEEPGHCCGSANSQPGIGVFNNLWVTNPDGSQFWRLTDIPIKRFVGDGIPAVGTVNPHFNHAGNKIVWTERYAEGGNWGRWRIKSADFVVSNGVPSLQNEHVVLQPPANPDGGIYVTSMGWSHDDSKLILAGNLDGQHEFGMDHYVYTIATGQRINLTNTPEFWEEDSCLAAGGQLVFMSNVDSEFGPVDPDDPEWWTQPRTREYQATDLQGTDPHAVTGFNDPEAPEYTGQRTIVADCSFASDGERMASIVGLDRNSGDTADIELTIQRLTFNWANDG